MNDTTNQKHAICNEFIDQFDYQWTPLSGSALKAAERHLELLNERALQAVLNSE
jgi:hypothetical protein